MASARAASNAISAAKIVSATIGREAALTMPTPITGSAIAT